MALAFTFHLVANKCVYNSMVIYVHSLHCLLCADIPLWISKSLVFARISSGCNYKVCEQYEGIG